MDNADLAALTQQMESEEIAVTETMADPQTMTEEIPEGYVRDRVTREIRPSKRPGRKRRTEPPPALVDPINRVADQKPDSKARGKVRQPTPRYQKGVIAAGMTKLYKRTGRIVKAIDRPIGVAIIESAEDCGEAWDELAKSNPRVRAFLMKLVSGGAWGAVIMAHAPIFMAVLMKDGIRKHIPFMKLVETMMTDESDGEDGNPFGDMFGNMTPEDMSQVMGMANQMMAGMARNVPGTVRRGNDETSEE